MAEEVLYFNGINGASGEYDLPPMSGAELAGFIRGEKPPENLKELRFRHLQATSTTMGVKEGIDPKKLEESGWGIIFPYNADPAIKEALQELIDLRQGQAGDYFKLYFGPDGYRTDETKTAFLARHGAGPGPADPEKVPYYLLIVGNPQQIPYEFQTQLDVQYAVGRIGFDDPQDYASYARSVVMAEKKQVKLPRQAAFFGVANPGDRATQLSADSLVEPLQTKFAADLKDWEVNGFLREQATKSQLSRLLGGDQTPALLFTGSHGMSFPIDSNLQVPHQGALLCQDWPGPDAWAGKGAIPQDYFFAGDDLSADAGLLGLIAFLFACYGAGTPLDDEFSKQAFKQRMAIAKYPFLGQLPMKLLSHPRGGALAVIGHIERAWGYSFMWPEAGKQTTVFESSLQRLFNGHPVGSAFEFFNERYSELSTVLSDELENIEFGKNYDPYELAGMWTANNDARGYTILGDPAVRLPIAQAGEKTTPRPALETVTVSAAPAAGQKQPASAKSGPKRSKTKPAAAPPQAPAPQPVTPSGQPTTVAPAVPPLVDAMAVNYGLLDTLSDARTRLTISLQTFSDNLGKALAKAVDDATTLEVSTYVSSNMSTVQTDLSGAQLRAFTRIRMDGDTEVIVPEQSGQIDRDLWEIHLSMVQQAQANRSEMIKAAASAATGLLQALKVL
jgi:hypothetical protein